MPIVYVSETTHQKLKVTAREDKRRMQDMADQCLAVGLAIFNKSAPKRKTIRAVKP